MIVEDDRTRADGVQGHAMFSPDRAYRYALSRLWAGHHGTLIFILLNPSTADAHDDDPTVRRCMGFAIREGYSGIIVVNLFALRSANPRALREADDPVGPDNQATLMGMCAAGRPVVAAWGANASHPLLRQQANWMHTVLSAARFTAGEEPRCFGWTNSSQPRHPLYLRGDTPLEKLYFRRLGELP